jgi:hypothetical protein
MSQPVGLNYKSRIPQFSDSASIEEALRVYHYGVDNYSTQTLPDDSIEGNFRSLDNRLTANESNSIYRVSESTNPNVIQPENDSTVALALKNYSGQTANIQEWRDSSGGNLAVVFSDGSSSFSGHLSVGTSTKSLNSSLMVQVTDSDNVGITVKATSGQNANIQEWRDSSGSTMSWVDNEGRIYSRGDEVGAGVGGFFLLGV